MNSEEQLLGFYSGRCGDARGRFLKDILAWSDDTLEDVHDYIQWLFPLTEPSAFNPHAPLLGDAALAEFRESRDLQRNMIAAFARMLRFYGFEMASEEPCIIQTAPEFAKRARVWLTAGNHNHLRITRILKSLRLVGLSAYARAFLEALTTVYNRTPRPPISAETFRYWLEAVQGR